MLYDHGSTAEVSAAEMAAARITPALDAEGGTGATALLHGILATLSESLERLDRRLVALESATEGRLARMEEGVAALTEALRAATEAEAEADPEPDHGQDELLHALDAMAGRIETHLDDIGAQAAEAVTRLGAGLSTSMAGLSASMDALDSGLDEVRDAIPEPDDGAATRAALRDEINRMGRGLHDEIERLGVLVRGQVAEVSGQAASVAAVLGRLDGRLHDLVDGVRVTAQQARALRQVDGEPEPVPESLSLS